MEVVCSIEYLLPQDVDGKLNDIANNTKITAWASSVIATQVPDWKREAQDRANKTYI